jgi:outer membrane protein OmpA-like peptidoglycan-associated protein
MTASGYARGSSGAGSAGIATDRGSGSARYALAAGLLLLGIGALAAIDGVLLPRYFARPAKTGPLTPAAEPRPQAILVAPREEPASAPPPEPALQPALQAAEQPQAPRPTEEPAPIPPAAPAAPAAQVEPAKPEFPHLLFARSAAAISPAAGRILAEVAETLAQDPSRRVVLGGHTDDIGPPDINMALSLARARRSGKWLERLGVDTARIEIHGFGSTQPLDGDGSSRVRAKNRRVEIDLR